MIPAAGGRNHLNARILCELAKAAVARARALADIHTGSVDIPRARAGCAAACAGSGLRNGDVLGIHISVQTGSEDADAVPGALLFINADGSVLHELSVALGGGARSRADIDARRVEYARSRILRRKRRTRRCHRGRRRSCSSNHHGGRRCARNRGRWNSGRRRGRGTNRSRLCGSKVLGGRRRNRYIALADESVRAGRHGLDLIPAVHHAVDAELGIQRKLTDGRIARAGARAVVHGAAADYPARNHAAAGDENIVIADVAGVAARRGNIVPLARHAEQRQRRAHRELFNHARARGSLCAQVNRSVFDHTCGSAGNRGLRLRAVHCFRERVSHGPHGRAGIVVAQNLAVGFSYVRHVLRAALAHANAVAVSGVQQLPAVGRLGGVGNLQTGVRKEARRHQIRKRKRYGNLACARGLDCGRGRRRWRERRRCGRCWRKRRRWRRRSRGLKRRRGGRR
ncbi:hypothetical protein SDC9_115300 [bioreactor metagenome]|uniref:Uncharacterized protein n=1 Tax=bioreactor metagenome TaxID=1076179 RepID=A0A645BTG4_9ZZZZ